MTTLRANREVIPAWSRVGFQPPKRRWSEPRHVSPVSSAGLGQLFDAVWQSGDAETLSALRRTCVAFVQRLHNDGRTPEQVLVALKREITEGGIVHRAPSLCSPLLDPEDLARARVYEQLFAWFLEACFVT